MMDCQKCSTLNVLVILLSLLKLIFCDQRVPDIFDEPKINMRYEEDIMKHDIHFNDDRIYKLWSNFKQTYKRVLLAIHDEQYRLNIFTENVAIIDKHNAAYARNETTYEMGINKFTDRDIFELRHLCGANSWATLIPRHIHRDQYKYQHNSIVLPRKIDWRENNLVTPVKDQGDCGSCYAFSATGSIEGQFAKNYHYLESFSEQQLVDCSYFYYNHGCVGGYIDNTFDYILRAGGLTTEKQYPYIADRNDDCRYISKMAVVKLRSYVDIEKHNETMLLEAVATQGPVSVVIDAEDSIFKYKSGIYDGADCTHSREYYNHAVLIVGYGEENGIPYWIVKNSWGTDWGEEGYIKMLRGKDLCSISLMASYPIVEKPSF